MFCDMVGSSALSTRLDPEEQRDVVSGFQGCCAAEIKRLGGMVAQYLGDGVLAYFGYPAAHEDDAERAVHAGLAILGAVSSATLGRRVRLEARIGIATGVVVVGDLVHEGVTQENAAIGETTNLAARLQALAEPGTLLVCPETHRLVGVLFEYRDLGRHELKGFAKPMHVHQVMRASKVENRFEARRADVASPLLGRDEELELLLRRWEQAKRGEGRVVLLTGEAGIGKSRLTRALQERLRAEAHTSLTYHCSPYHQDSAFYPVIAQLTRAAGIERDDTEARLRKLETLLAQSSANLADDVPLFAALLSIPLGENYQLPKVAPQRLKDFTLQALITQLSRLAARQPVLMTFEDMHWVDPTTLELLSLAVSEAKGLPLLMVATARPEFTPPWPSHRHLTTVDLTRLDRGEGEALVAGVTRGKALPAEVLEQIVARTDGIPLFIEELTKTVLESGLLREGDQGYELTGPLPPLAIPSTLHASLLARLDRLSTVKEVAQIAAVAGREFPYALIAAVAGLPEKDLDAGLAQLVAAEIVFQRGTPPNATYQFKHALVQDAAYSSLVRSRRHQFHAQIASALREQFPDVEAALPEIIAHHLTEGGLPDDAIEQWEVASDRAASRSANFEAINHLSRAISLLPLSAHGSSTARLELPLQLKLGSLVLMSAGPASEQAERVYERARALCAEAGSPADQFTVAFSRWYISEQRTQFGKARELIAEARQIAAASTDPRLLLQAHHAAWTTDLTTGAFKSCLHDAQQGIEHYHDADRSFHVQKFANHDPMVCALGHSAITEWVLGFPERAFQVADRTSSMMEEVKHIPTTIVGQYALCILFSYARRVDRLRLAANQMVAACEQLGAPQYTGIFMVFAGYAQALETRHVDSV